MAESGGLLRREEPSVHAGSAGLLAGRTFVVFADDWGRHPSSCQHLFRRLLPGNRVLWVNTIGTRAPGLSRGDLVRAWGKLREWTARGGEREPGADARAGAAGPRPDVLAPVMIPFDGVPGARAFNARSIRGTVAAALGADAPIVVTTIPDVAEVVGTLGEALSVYYCVDEFSEWPGANRGALLRHERELLSRVDLVLATAETLFEAKSARHPRVRMLRHGVDWDRFRTGSGTAPASLAALPRPRFGFVGLIDERLDVPLVASVARAMPDASFVFVGPRQLPPGPLDAIANVHFPGAVPYEDVPAVLHAFDVAILPYVVNELTERINPLKLRELLASGVPIVATGLPEIARFGALLRTPEGTDGWRDALRTAFAGGGADAGERAGAVRNESWERRAEEFSRHCREAEREKRR
jgi:Glycosyl transferases group 1